MYYFIYYISSMTDKAKTLGEYKENLGEKLKDLPGSENLKKEYKGKLFREIVADPEYKTLKAEYLNEKRSESAKEKIFQEAFAHAKKINPSLTEEDFRAVLIGKTEKKESKETDLSDLQNKILSKPNMTAHHKQWFQKKTDELIKNKDKDGLEQLDKNIDFTEKGWLIVNTPNWPLKFAPRQAKLEDIKNIDWLKEGENFWTENKETKKKWLWANFEASKKMRKSGKKICSDEQYLAAANAFPWEYTLNKDNWSTKVKNFFDLLWVDQYGLRDPDGYWYNNNRILWSSSIDGNKACSMGCYADGGILNRSNKGYGFGVWFLED